MNDLNNIIGLTVKEAQLILNKNGYKNINIINNYKHNDKCDTLLVCAVRQSKNDVTLIVGEFYVGV